jgi:hypothetical protein
MTNISSAKKILYLHNKYSYRRSNTWWHIALATTSQSIGRGDRRADNRYGKVEQRFEKVGSGEQIDNVLC